jgi:hypothetical protein
MRISGIYKHSIEEPGGTARVRRAPTEVGADVTSDSVHVTEIEPNRSRCPISAINPTTFGQTTFRSLKVFALASFFASLSDDRPPPDRRG